MNNQQKTLKIMGASKKIMLFLNFNPRIVTIAD